MYMYMYIILLCNLNVISEAQIITVSIYYIILKTNLLYLQLCYDDVIELTIELSENLYSYNMHSFGLL